MFFAADKRIPIPFVPDAPRPTELLVHLPGGKPLPGMHNLLQRKPRFEPSEKVDVIWHNHKAIDGVSFRIEMKDGRRNELRAPRVLQHATAQALIHPLLKSCREIAMKLVFRFRVPWLRMMLYPIVTVAAPCFKKPRRNGIRKPPCDENPYRILLPVREMVQVLSDW